MVKNLPNCKSVCKAVRYSTTHKVTSNGTIAKNVQGSISLTVLCPKLIVCTLRQTLRPLKAPKNVFNYSNCNGYLQFQRNNIVHNLSLNTKHLVTNIWKLNHRFYYHVLK